MFKRILVAIDGSSSAESALSVAASLSGIMKSELIGVFVESTERFEKSRSEESVEAELEAESMKLYEKFQQTCAKANIEGRYLSIRGVPKDVIRERTKAVDFLVLGNLGKYAEQSEAVDGGFTLQELLKTVARPVLVVPADVAGEPKIVVAYDGSVASDRLLATAAQLAEFSDMDSLHLVTVSSDIEECQSIQAPAVDYLSAYALQVVPVCLTGNPEEALISYVDEIDASILAVAAFGPNRVKDSVFGKTTEEVLRQSDVAVLLVS